MDKKIFQQKLHQILKSNFVYSKARQKIINEALKVFSSLLKEEPYQSIKEPPAGEEINPDKIPF